MADPYQLLAPLVEPPLPPVPLPAAAPAVSASLIIGVVALFIVAVVVLYWLWRRSAPQRTLRHIARLQDPVQAAHQLARLVFRQGALPPPTWQQALDRVRFGPPSAEHPATLAQLCTEAKFFMRAA